MTMQFPGAPAAVACLVSLSIAASGCSRARVAPEPAAAPSVAAAGLPRCTIVPSQLRPLIVEWSGADRGSLELRLQRGPVAVRYEGCTLELLPGCEPPGAYTYAGFTHKRDTVAIHSADDLFTQMPVGASRLEGILARTGALQVDMTLVGMYQTGRSEYPRDELTGRCDGATHVIAAAQVGAFALYAGANRDAAATGARSTDSHEVVNIDGDQAACAAARAADVAAPEGCAAVVRLELAPVVARRVAAQTWTPPPPPPRADDRVPAPEVPQVRAPRASEPDLSSRQLRRQKIALLAVGYTLLPVGLGLLGAATVGNRRRDAAIKALKDPSLSPMERAELEERRRAGFKLALGTGLASVVVCATSLVLQVVGLLRPTSASRTGRVGVGPMIGRSTGGLDVSVRF